MSNVKKRVIAIVFCFLAFVLGISQDETKVYAAQQTPDIVVVLDPGHDAKHGGATHYGLYEHEVVFKIASYCKAELEKYSGVTVYLTRPSNACPQNAGMTSVECNYARVDYAASVGADVYISFHLDAVERGNASGASIYYPNSNYRPDLAEEGKVLASNVLNDLMNIGINKNGTGIKIRNSKDGTTYPDGSLADYLVAVKGPKLKGIPGILIEHMFLTNAQEVSAFLSTEEKIQNVGIADATGIANALGLTKHDVRQAEDGNWYYYVDGVIDTSYTGLAKNENGWFYIESGVVNWNYTGLVHHYDTWFYVSGGVVDLDYTGLVHYCGVWFYVENGVLNWNYTGLAQYYDKWVYVENGVLNANYTGLTCYKDVWFYVENGVLNWNYTGMAEHCGGWFYIENGALNWNYTGLVQYYDAWVYVENGVLNANYTGLTCYKDVWFYVENGALNWNFTGLAEHCGGWFYIENGALNWNYTGTVYYNGILWYVEKGVVIGVA